MRVPWRPGRQLPIARANLKEPEPKCIWTPADEMARSTMPRVAIRQRPHCPVEDQPQADFLRRCLTAIRILRVCNGCAKGATLSLIRCFYKHIATDRSYQYVLVEGVIGALLHATWTCICRRMMNSSSETTRTRHRYL